MTGDEEGLRRRDFLRRTAYTAGLAALSSALPLDTLLGEAARTRALASGMPSPSTMPIDHVVVLMMENRSFDHYFGWYSDLADAVQTRTYADPDAGGTPVDTRHASFMGTAEFQGCGHPDPDHSWEGGRAQLGSARTDPLAEPDGFLAGANDEFALSYFNEGDVPFIHAAGKAFTVYDRFFCSLLGPTWPNRYYKWSAQSGGRRDNTPPVQTAGNQWDTIFDLALRAGATARYYHSDLPFSAVWGPRGIPWTRPVADYYADCATGTLPNVTIVDPPFRDGGGGDGLSADEHPLGDVRLGQAFMSDVVRAFVESPCWERGALFVVYDEWGGFFDHVRPPSVPDARQSANIDDDFGQMGFRIPAMCVSPYAFRGEVSHLQCGFESILSLIEYRFGLGSLTTRDAQANNIGLSMNWDAPVLERPDLPDFDHVLSRPCSVGGGDLVEESHEAHANDLAALEELAERFGFSAGAGKVDDIFRSPDSVKRAVAATTTAGGLK